MPLCKSNRNEKFEGLQKSSVEEKRKKEEELIGSTFNVFSSFWTSKRGDGGKKLEDLEASIH